MIYTVTMNPSLDYTVKLQNFTEGKVNRTTSEALCAGGKGINVALVLKALGVNVKALGFYGSDIGKIIVNKLKLSGLDNLLIETEGQSRINIKLCTNEQTEINGRGINITADDLNKLKALLKKLNKNDVLVLSGSARSDLGDKVYSALLKEVNPDVITVIDACGKLLLNTLCDNPFLIKPNIDELSEFFGEDIKTREKIIECAKSLQNKGAKNVLISMGAKGAILLNQNGDVFEAKAPNGTLVNAVGAGDSMVAGFIYAFLKDNDFLSALKYSIASGSATAFSEGLADRESIEALLDKVKIIY